MIYIFNLIISSKLYCYFIHFKYQEIIYKFIKIFQETIEVII